jgi:hypothetical protein
MAELRELHRGCICGGPPTYKCRRCQSKKYCSIGCQRRDWPLHRQQCTNEQLLSSVIDNASTNLSLVEQHAVQMKKPHWQRFLMVIYDALRRRAGPHAKPHEYYVHWVKIRREGVGDNCRETESHVAFSYIVQEPTRLFMYVSAEHSPTDCNVFGLPQVVGETTAHKQLLDETCIVFDTDKVAGREPRKMMSLVYPVELVVPALKNDEDEAHRITIVDWDLRS